MRILLSQKSKKDLFNFLKEKSKCRSFRDLASSMNVSFNTLQTWLYEKNRYLPGSIIPNEISKNLEILDRKENNWGSVKGGRKTYQVIINKYGKEEIRRRQSNGGKRAIKILRDKNREEPFSLNVGDPIFLEFYGVLIGDGWIGKYQYKNKTNRMIGISGHSELDRNFFFYCKQNIKKLFNREAYLKEKRRYNGIELQFSHQWLFEFLQKELKFPVGKKINLKIHDKVYSLSFDKLRHVIRGLFDTDGSFYLDKMPNGKPYPCISIEMKAPLLILQLNNILIKEGFKVSYRKTKRGNDRITLKGKKQLQKWMKEIGSSNSKHMDKINKFQARVAQSG